MILMMAAVQPAPVTASNNLPEIFSHPDYFCMSEKQQLAVKIAFIHFFFCTSEK